MPAVWQSSTISSTIKDDEVDKRQLYNANGLDGNGNYFLTTADHFRLHSGLSRCNE